MYIRACRIWQEMEGNARTTDTGSKLKREMKKEKQSLLREEACYIPHTKKLAAAVLKMDLCKKLQSYLNTIFLGMASLLTASLLLLSCSLRAVFFRESDLTVNLRKINFPNI